MKNIYKYGLSALCGSLATISAANAGSMTIAGGATATHTTAGGTTGNPLGMATNMTFSGSGELDNGTAFSVDVLHADQNAWSAGNVTLTSDSLGTLKLSMAEGGGGIGGYDDKMPTAWEESWDTGNGAGIDHAKGVGSSTNISWVSPTFMGTTFQVAYAPMNDGKQPNDKAGGGAGNSYKQEGLDVVIETNQSFAGVGINLWAGKSETNVDNNATSTATKDLDSDHEEGNIGAILTFGPVSAGYQRSAEFTGTETAGNTDYYAANAYGVSFNVNDNLSISWSAIESRRGKHGSGRGATKTVDAEAEAFQIAYTIGGASIKIAESEVTNASYGTAASADKDGTTIALSLAF